MRGTAASGVIAISYTLGDIVAGEGTIDVVVDSTPGGGEGGGGAGGGTIATDPSVFLAWSARDIKVGAVVEVAGGALSSLNGEVSIAWSLRDPVKRASFSVADKRVSRYVVGSLADGDKPVAITLLAGPSSSIQSWQAFAGHTDGNQNDGPYLPRGTFPCISYAGDWIGRPGCVRSPGLQGFTRGYILYAYALSAGIPIDPAVQYLGRIVARPFEYNSVNILELFERLGEIEGLSPRITDDNVLSFVSDRDMFSGEPVYHFDDSNSFNATDQSPQHPPTAFTLSGSRMTEESLGDEAQTTKVTTVAGVDANGYPFLTTTTVTSERGVILRSVVEESETFQRDGVVLGPLDFQLRRRTEIENTWERAATLPYETTGRLTTQLNRRVQRVYDTTGIPCRAADGFLWVGGQRCTTDTAALLLVQETSWDVHWNTTLAGIANCTLESQIETIKEWYAPLERTGLGGELYADGSRRDGVAYTWRTVTEGSEAWKDYRFLGAIAPEVDVSRKLKRWVVTSIVSDEGTEAYVDAETQFESWIGNSTNTHYVHRLAIHSNSIASPAMSQGNGLLKAGRLLATTVDEGEGPVPGPPMGSANVPQFQQQPFFYSYTARLPYQPNKVVEIIEAAEDETELQNVAMRRLVMALCSTIKVQHPMLPYLQPGDPLTFSNVAREIVGRRAYVDAIEIPVNVTAGEALQTTTIKVLPDWPTWPPAEMGP